MDALTAQLESRLDLANHQVEEAVAWLTDAAVSDERKAAFLVALREKGETAQEIAAFVQAFLSRALDPQIDLRALNAPALDIVGTGGDKMDLFNVSTTSMFVLAAGGACVIKHGNRSVTSKCGSADVLETLGVQIDLAPAELRRCVEATGLGFVFAPRYHPAFKSIAPVRKLLAERGIPTIFNLLGPLLNPAQPEYQLAGVYSEALMEKYADVFLLLKRKHAWVVHGISDAGRGLDELSTMSHTLIRKVENAVISDFRIDAQTLESLGISLAKAEDLRGGDREENARILLGILEGKIRGAKRDVVLLNAAAGFVIAQLAPDLQSGIALANRQLDSDAALAKLRALQNFRG